MRVCLWTDTKNFAGTERHMLDLASSLRGIGVAASIACPVPSPLAERASRAGVPVHDVPAGGMVDREAHGRVARLFDEGVDLLHTHNGRTALNAAIALRGGRRGRSVMTQHFLDPSHVGRRGVHGWISRMAHHWVDRRTTAHIAISECVRMKMLERGGVPAERIHVVRNGAVAPDPTSLRSPSEVRAELGIPDGAPLVACAARLEAEKDVPTLVRAMAVVVRQNPEARCVIAGEGQQRESLQKEIEALSLTGNVRLLGFRNDVLSITNAADVFVLPSVAEPFGLVLLEAMTLGKPVIACRVGGPAEIVVEGGTGFLVPPSDPASLGEAIGRVLGDRPAAQRMGAEGRRRFAEMFTAERMARETLAVYEAALRQ